MSMNKRLKPVANQDSPYQSPWSTSTRIKNVLFNTTWALTCRLTPNQLNFWRIFVLRLFGAKISGRPYVAPSARITMPWNITLEHRACLAPGSELYALGPIVMRERCTLSQHGYVCTGSHDITAEELPLVVGPVEIGADAFIFAFVFVAPGISIGEGAVIGACSVVTKDMPAWTICAGSPCKPIKPRVFPGAPGSAPGEPGEQTQASES